MKVLQKLFNLWGKMFPRKHTFSGRDFTIISSNCIGGRVYHDFGLMFKTPTINLFFEASDFISFVLNLEYYLQKDIVFTAQTGDYPIGIIDDHVRVHFLHYENSKVAKDKWESRKRRVVASNVFIVMTDRDGFSEDLQTQFDLIPYKKVLFTSKKIDRKDAVYMPEFKRKPCVGIMTDFCGFTRKRYYELHFDFAKWLTGDYDTADCVI